MGHWVNIIGWSINFIGLLVSFWGSFLLFKGTPRDTIPGEQGYELILPREAEKNSEDFIKRQQNSNKGFQLLFIGFIIQIFSQIFFFPR